MESIIENSEIFPALLTVAVAILVASWLFPNKEKGNKNHKEPPVVPGALPILGHAVEFGKDPTAFLMRCHAQYGGTFQIRLVGQTYVMCDGAHRQIYFSLPEKQLSFDQALLLSGVASDSTVGKCTVVSPWHVPILKRALSDKRMVHYTARIERQVYKTLSALGINEQTLPVGGGGDDTTRTIVLDDLKPLAWDIVAHSSGTSFLGEDLIEKNPHVIEVFKEFHKACLLVIQASNFLPESLAGLLATQAKKHRRILRAVVVPEVERRRASSSQNGDNNRKDGDNDDEDVLAWLINTGKPAVELADRFMAFIFASMITTAGAMTNVLYDLAGHQDQWQVLMDEQEEVMKKHGTDVTQSSMRDMHRLHAFVLESIRSAALPIQQTRLAVKEGIELEPGSGMCLPKGAVVAISGVLANTLVDRSSEFLPERFLNEDGTILDDPSSIGFFPFGIGRHYCPGRHFAYTEIKGTMTVLLRNFRFETVSGGIPQYKSVPADTERIPEPIRFSRIALPPVSS